MLIDNTQERSFHSSEAIKKDARQLEPKTLKADIKPILNKDCFPFTIKTINSLSESPPSGIERSTTQIDYFILLLGRGAECLPIIRIVGCHSEPYELPTPVNESKCHQFRTSSPKLY